MKKELGLISALLGLVIGTSYADDGKLTESLSNIGIKNAEVQQSPVAGLKTVLADNGVFYVTEDGKYILQGPLFDISNKNVVNITNALITKKMEALKNEMIIYKAPKQKHVITVFTDVTCGYCQKLHQQIKEYNDEGITVRYLAFPRQGPNSPIKKEMESIWCSADKAKMLDIAMKGESVPEVKGCNVDINKQYNLGLQFGISGTPAIILENGMMIPGYQGPKEMAAMFRAQSAKTNG